MIHLQVVLPTVNFYSGRMPSVFTIGSGDREKPLTDFSVTYGVTNYFYSLVDQPLNAVWLDDSADNEGPYSAIDLICHDALTDKTKIYDPDQVIADKGWKMVLRDGEQVVKGSIVADNVANFSTHIPAVPESYDAEYGTATGYEVNYANGNVNFTEFIGGGLVTTLVVGKVLIDVVPTPFCKGCGDEGSAIGVGTVGGAITCEQPRSRVFWNIDEVDP